MGVPLKKLLVQLKQIEKVLFLNSITALWYAVRILSISIPQNIKKVCTQRDQI